MIRSTDDYLVPLMRLLDRLPQRSGRRLDVINLFGNAYGNQIAQDQFSTDATGHIRWEHRICWSRVTLKSLGFIDSPMHGVWRLTESCHQWLIENPDSTRLFPMGKGKSSKETSRGLSSRDTPQTKKQPKSSPQVQFSFSPQNPEYIALGKEIEGVRAFIQGRTVSRPNDEKICDWISLCYLTGLYREGQELFALVSHENVHSWYYEKTKKLARLCELKTTK